MEAVASRFPSLGLTLDDVLSCYAGVRPVISSGASDPSKESREHLVLEEEGLSPSPAASSPPAAPSRTMPCAPSSAACPSWPR